MTLKIAVVAGGAALLVGVVVATITLTGSGGLPVVTTVPSSIPAGGVALWQADQRGRPTGLAAYLHRPRSPERDMPGYHAEEAVLLMDRTPGSRITAATLASVTLPGTAPTVSQWRTLDAWIVTLKFPHPSELPLGCLARASGSGHRPSPCPTFVVSKELVYVDAGTGAAAVLVSTN
jgi:hypothetical protein